MSVSDWEKPMNRTNLSPAERNFPSRLAQLAHDNWPLRGISKMGHRELRLQLTGPWLGSRPHLQTRGQGHRGLPADGVPGLQHLSCLPRPEPQTPTSRHQAGEILGLD